MTTTPSDEVMQTSHADVPISKTSTLSTKPTMMTTMASNKEASLSEEMFKKPTGFKAPKMKNNTLLPKLTKTTCAETTSQATTTRMTMGANLKKTTVERVCLNKEKK
ncbi:hypothetical protein RFI_07285, partial [Reticulomyxa filosa]